MKLALFILTVILVFMIIYLYFNYTYHDMTYVKSDVDNKYYLVQNSSDKQEAANLLAKIYEDICKLSECLNNNKNSEECKDYKEYIELLNSKVPNIVLVESTQDSLYTSYSVNKGEQIVFCLRTKRTGNKLHDYNIIMYVVLHEISHVACPIYDNHGPLFRKIFAFIASQGVKEGIYTKVDFNKKAEEYCGMDITESII